MTSSDSGGIYQPIHAAACSVISEISVRLWPSVVPNLVIHTSTLDVRVRSWTAIRWWPGCSGVVGVNSVVSSSFAGVSVGDEGSAPRFLCWTSR
jgi:hypothetical protein